MSGQIKPVGIDLSPAAEGRHRMLLNRYDRLQEFAHRALKVRNLPNTEFVIVCILVDSRWKGLVDHLMPNAEPEWDSYRAMGVPPLAQGIVSAGLLEYLARKFPDMAHIILEKPQEEKAKCIVLDDTGCTVYEIPPKEDK